MNTPVRRSPPVFLPLRARILFGITFVALSVTAFVGLYLIAKGLGL